MLRKLKHYIYLENHFLVHSPFRKAKEQMYEKIEMYMNTCMCVCVCVCMISLYNVLGLHAQRVFTRV